MIYVILFILALYVFAQIYFSLRDVSQKQTTIEVLLTITRAVFQIVFATWLILFTILGYLGTIHF